MEGFAILRTITGFRYGKWRNPRGGRGKKNRCPRSRNSLAYIFQTFDKITMRALSCAHNRSHRLGKRRSSLRNSTVLARIAGSWQSGACYVQRAENPRALAFFPSPPPLPLSSPPFFIIICDPPLFSFSLCLSQFLSPSLAARPENRMRPRRGLVFTPRRFYPPIFF